MSQVVFGYILAEKVLFDIEKGRLTSIRSPISDTSGSSIVLRRTMVMLLAFLLERRKENAITVDEILYHVWDKNYLQSSTQRLWQVMKGLKIKLQLAGIEEDFIIRKDKQSYIIAKELVVPLYVKRS